LDARSAGGVASSGGGWLLVLVPRRTNQAAHVMLQLWVGPTAMTPAAPR
jgi:hypothetical protein